MPFIGSTNCPVVVLVGDCEVSVVGKKYDVVEVVFTGIIGGVVIASSPDVDCHCCVVGLYVKVLVLVVAVVTTVTASVVSVYVVGGAVVVSVNVVVLVVGLADVVVLVK